MAQIFRAPEDTSSVKKETFKIFLAGSIEQGKAEEWQTKLEKYLEKYDLAIFNPRRLDYQPDAEQSKDNPYFRNQVEWELEHIEKADLVVFYIDPNTKSPITLMEIGIVAKDVYTMKKRGIIYCPKGFYRKGNVDIVGEWFDFSIANSMKEFGKKILTHYKDFNWSQKNKLG